MLTMLGLLSRTVLVFSSLCDLSLSFQITGVAGGYNVSAAGRPFRYEISDFAQKGPVWDLFILALQRFQSINQSDPLSYFQVAGIHGYPEIPWDGVAGAEGSSYPGYCMHASVVFPTWHRPYLALYEQLISQHAQYIAQAYPINQRITYLNAAAALRIPYWDWVLRPALPNAITLPFVTVNTPDGLQQVPNPLYQYVFRGNASENGFPDSQPLADFRSTVRWFDFNTQQSNQSQATAVMISSAPSVLNAVYNLFTATKDYSAFSCTSPGGANNGPNNVENIHNLIHNNIGGQYGHMTYPEVSAFDPAFWLHHTNVDRLFAMWQALNPNNYVVPTSNAYGSYYELSGTVDTGDTTLAPFHTGNGSAMYSSDSVRRTATFGYTYPELVDWNVSSSDLARNVRTIINKMYNPNRSASSRRATRVALLRSEDLMQVFNQITLETALDLEVNNLDVQWSIEIELERYATDRNFAIYFFLGDPPGDTLQWPIATNLIGTYAQFIAANVSRMQSDEVQAGRQQGEVFITHTLAAAMARGVLHDLTPEYVVPLLKKFLVWNSTSATGDVIDVERLACLSIRVFSRQVKPRRSDGEFPTYGARIEHRDVTDDKAGGGTR